MLERVASCNTGSVDLFTKHSLERSILQIFLYLEAFECNTTSDWLTIRFSQSKVVLHSNLQNYGEKKTKHVTENG